jgi:hypothetical protein
MDTASFRAARLLLCIGGRSAPVLLTVLLAALACLALTTQAALATPGTQLWAKRYDGLFGGDAAQAVAASLDGSRVFVTGYSQGSTSSADYATLAYDASTGTRLWLRRYNGPANREDQARALGVSPDRSKVFVTGSSVGVSSDFDYGTVAYAASTGAELWVKRYNGPANSADGAEALGVSPEGSSVFVAGPSYGTTTRVDAATAAYAASTGTKLWLRRYKDPGNRLADARALAVSPVGLRVFITGATKSEQEPDYLTVAYSTG